MAADVRRPQSWAAVAAVVCLAACCNVGSVGAQLISTDLTNSTLALTSKGFADALSDSHVSTITLDSTVKLSMGDFEPTMVVDRNVTITASNNTAAGVQPTLNFNHGVDLILVGSQGTLTFSNVLLAQLASADSGNAGGDNVVQALALWPSVSGEPGASFVFVNTSTEYAVPNNYNNCTQYQQRVATQLRALLGAGSVSQPDANTVLVTGHQEAKLPVTSNQITTGQVDYISQDSSSVCTADTGGGGSHFPWWAGLVLGLSIALIVSVILCAVAAVYLVRLRRRNMDLVSQRDVESAKGDTGTGTGTGTTGSGSPPGGSGWTPPGSSDRIGGDSAGSTLAPLLSGDAMLRSNSNPRARLSAGPPRKDSGLSEYHAQLLAMRMQSGLEGVEVGPVLGRGSYGCVYKGRWRGVLVAIKIVEAPLDNYSADAARESLLSASISHPNVVACYKICAVRTGAAASSETESGTVSAAGTGPAAGKQASQVLTDADIAAAQATPGVSADIPPPAPVRGSGSSDSPTMGQAVQVRRGSTHESEVTVTSATRSVDNVLLEVLGTNSDAQDSQAQGSVETWMLLEYADRGSLEQAIQARRFYKRADATLDLGNVYRTLLDIANGIHYLHSVGIVHGDLKPANVLLKSTATDARGFICKLADFGLSRLVNEHKTHISAATMGTVSYMPPEMLNEQRLTKAVDVYSLGIIMCQLYSGTTPYAGMSMPAVLFAVVQQGQRPDVAADMPEDYRTLMMRCWDSEQQNRPTVEEVIRELAMQAKALAARAAAPPPPAAAAAPTKRSNSFSLRDLLPKKKSSSSESEGAVGGRRSPGRRIKNGSSSSSAGRRSGSATPDLEDSAGPPTAVAAAVAAAGLHSADAKAASSSPPSVPPFAALATSESQASTASNAGSELSFAAGVGPSLSRGSTGPRSATVSPATSAEAEAAAAPPAPEAALAAAAAAAAALGGGGNDGREQALMFPGPPPPPAGRRRADPLSSVAEEASRAGSSGSRSSGSSIAGRFASKTAPVAFAADAEAAAAKAAGASTVAGEVDGAAAAPLASSPSEAFLRQHSLEGSERFRPLMLQGRSEGGTIRYSLEGRRAASNRRSMERRRAVEAPPRLETTAEAAQAPAGRDPAAGGDSSPGRDAPRKAASAGEATTVQPRAPAAGQQLPAAAAAGAGVDTPQLQPAPSPFQAAAAAAGTPATPGGAAGRTAAGDAAAAVRSGGGAAATPPPEAAAAGLALQPKDSSLGAAADAAVQALAAEKELKAAASAALHAIE